MIGMGKSIRQKRVNIKEYKHTCTCTLHTIFSQGLVKNYGRFNGHTYDMNVYKIAAMNFCPHLTNKSQAVVITGNPDFSSKILASILKTYENVWKTLDRNIV